MAVTDRNRMDDLKRALPEMGANVVAEAAREGYEAQQEGWSKGESALGTPWAPLSPETIRQKTGTRILIDSADMKDAYDVGVDRSLQEARIGPTTDRAALLTRFHEHGVPERNLPARPIQEPTARYITTHLEDITERELSRDLAALTL